jgi:hypothetical protein
MGLEGLEAGLQEMDTIAVLAAQVQVVPLKY